MDIHEKNDDGPVWEDRIGQLRDHEINCFGGNTSGSQLLQYERNLNFATVAMDEGEYGFPKKKTIRDPLSHRIIEKRRRDRMNNCLADLARLLPQASLRKGRGRIEKTEIVELAIKHLRHLQTHPCPHGDSCELNPMKSAGAQRKTALVSVPSLTGIPMSVAHTATESRITSQVSVPVTPDPFQLGFQECLNEAMHFLLESKTSTMMVNDTESYTKLCLQLAQHLNQHVERNFIEHANKKRKLSNGFSRQGSDTTLNTNEFNQKKFSGSSISSGYRPNGTPSPGSDANGGNDGDSTHREVSVQNSSFQYYNDHETHALDCDADHNSSSSTPLSIEVSDVLSSDGRINCNGHLANKLSIPPTVWEKHSPTIRITSCPSVSRSVSNCRSSDEGHEILSPTSHRYKFKNTIKQRFTADSQTKTEPDTESNSSFSKSDHHSNRCEDQVRDFVENEPEISREARDQLVSSPGSEGMPEMSTCRNAFIPRVSVVDLASLAECNEPEVIVNTPLVVRGVPAFVLHDKGSFYIPLTIDRSVVADAASLGDFDDQNFNRTPFPLHPVTISVCYAFNKDNKVRSDYLATEKKPNTHLTVPPVVIRDSKKLDNMKEIPKSDSNFIMNRFEKSQIETRRYHNSNFREARCPDSNLNYRNCISNQPIYRLGNTTFTNYEGRQIITSNKTAENILETNSYSPMVLRKDHASAKSAFVGYNSWRNSDYLSLPADLSSKKNISESEDKEHPEMTNIRNRKINSLDFHPTILSNVTCSSQPKRSKDIRE